MNFTMSSRLLAATTSTIPYSNKLSSAMTKSAAAMGESEYATTVVNLKIQRLLKKKQKKKYQIRYFVSSHVLSTTP